MNNSSSNPFRRSVHSSEYTDTSLQASVSDAYTADDNATPHPKASTTTKKHVRISSPPRSPGPRREDGQANDASLVSQDTGAYYDGSSAAPARQITNQNWQDYISGRGEGSSSEDGDTDTMVMTVAQAPRIPNAPHNPLGRTLADMEESLRVSNSGKTPEVADLNSQAGRSTTRAAMDVNAFKNLLMTGKPSPKTADLPILSSHRTSALTQADNSSSTDISSISRHSVVENTGNETPRTSYERSISDEEEDATAVPQRTASKRVKPPPPRHRHGKSVNSLGPQIVAFDEFSTLKPEQELASPAAERPIRSSSELRRPLPPIPPTAAPRLDAMPFTDEPQNITPSPDILEQVAQSKKPPPPPLARRSSQRTPVPSISRPRSGTASSRPSLMEDNESIAESTTSSTRMAPPPPPARRSGNSGSHPADEGSSSSINRIPSLKSPPPPPVRNRASSNLSSNSIPSTLSTTPTATSSSAPPKPPPPRRTSSRSSIEILSPRRTSGEIIRSSFDSDRRPSMSSSIRRVPITEEPVSESAIDSTTVASPGTKDVLADMDAFRREIDAMMARDELGKRKGSSGSASMQRPGR